MKVGGQVSAHPSVLKEETRQSGCNPDSPLAWVAHDALIAGNNDPVAFAAEVRHPHFVARVSIGILSP